ncbi:hypothetical protein LIER_37393 [Lithospermum erythrorhizon]|uniref:Reverse transcriptase n=1 Tax=Lithospermum erythrorhizon TaxID=34254 RepID=A0AAV3PJX3_LITER
MRVLHKYEEASGPKINLAKCSVSFDSSASNCVQREMLSVLGMREVTDHEKYLGLPSNIGRSKKEVFSFIMGRVEDRMREWKGKLLSQAGKEVMIKSITSAIPIFVINCFKLPVGIIDNLNSSMARFFWGNAEGDRGIHSKSWDKLCEDKLDGGLGFKDLECMNWAMLPKQGWRIVTKQASLLFIILKGRYFRRSSFTRAKLEANPSFGWHSLLERRKVLLKGLRWQVGDGRNIDMWTEPWVPHNMDFLLRDVRKERPRWLYQLIKNGEWDREAVESCIEGDDLQRVLAIPLSRRGRNDKFVWHHTR